MSAGNFVAVVAMVIFVWVAFAIFGEPWETRRANLVLPLRPETVAANDARAEALPDRMQVGSISPRPVQ